MKRLLFGFFFGVAAFCTQRLHGGDPPQIYMPDGQLISKPIRLYVSGTNLSEAMQPKLRLVGPQILAKSNAVQGTNYTARLVVSGHRWNEEVAGQTIPREGTLLLFDLNAYPAPWYKATVKFSPLLSWNAAPAGKEPELATLIGTPVYLGRLAVAVLWTAVVVGVLVLAFWIWSVQKRKHAVFLICGEDGYLSVWRTQLAAWTLAVGSLVFCFGLLRLEVPKIPESLVALMGMSVATGGFSSAKTQSHLRELSATGKKPRHNPNPPRLADLISSFSPTIAEGDLSIPKAQMVFWTGIILVLFISKSLLTGELWPVPWEMVALTGVSQVGYVSEKATRKQSA